MWLGNESSNWGTNAQPARTAETLKACTLENQSYTRRLPNQGSTATSRQGCPGSDKSKYLKFPYPSSNFREVHRVVLIALQTDILYSNLSTITTQQPKYPTHRQYR
ncbi:unnamed protein product [Prunus armeniaca]